MLAIVGILAAAVLPVLVRQIDYATEGAETTNLVALSAGFTQAASAQRYIPSQTNWDVFIATNIGWQLTAVQINLRNNPRVLLINPALPNLTLPYQQSSTGWPALPANTQFIILSSLSSPLPVSSGFPAVSSDFGALWNAPDDKLPPGLSWSFNGPAEDLKIQRINLTSSFIHLVLTSSDLISAPYSIDTFAPGLVTSILPIDAYFLRGTVINLYFRSTSNGTTTTNLQASQVLQQDTSLVFCNGLWRNAPCPVALGGLEPIVQAFYANVPHSSGNPVSVYNDMTNYMALYLQYAAGNFQNLAVRTLLQNASTNLNFNIQNLAY